MEEKGGGSEGESRKGKPNKGTKYICATQWNAEAHTNLNVLARLEIELGARATAWGKARG